MWWEKKNRRLGYLLGIPCFHAREIIVDVCREGYINWNVYQKAIDKTTLN